MTRVDVTLKEGERSEGDASSAFAGKTMRVPGVVQCVECKRRIFNNCFIRHCSMYYLSKRLSKRLDCFLHDSIRVVVTVIFRALATSTAIDSL